MVRINYDNDKRLIVRILPEAKKKFFDTKIKAQFFVIFIKMRLNYVHNAFLIFPKIKP